MALFTPVHTTQPILVHGSLGTGRTGCFCAVSIAIEMMELAKESITDAFDNDSNILDQVNVTHLTQNYCFIVIR